MNFENWIYYIIKLLFDWWRIDINRDGDWEKGLTLPSRVTSNCANGLICLCAFLSRGKNATALTVIKSPKAYRTFNIILFSKDEKEYQ